MDRKSSLPNIFCQYPVLDDHRIDIFSLTWTELIGIRSTLIERVLALGPLKGHTKIRTQKHSPWGNGKSLSPVIQYKTTSGEMVKGRRKIAQVTDGWTWRVTGAVGSVVEDRKEEATAEEGPVNGGSCYGKRECA
jgi:hypothetical protein